jgi:hypothetical protein
VTVRPAARQAQKALNTPRQRIPTRAALLSLTGPISASLRVPSVGLISTGKPDRGARQSGSGTISLRTTPTKSYQATMKDRSVRATGPKVSNSAGVMPSGS